MNELQKLIEKWDKQIALHRRVCDEPLMYTKEDRLKNSHYAQAICAVVDDLKKLTIPDVVGQSEQLVCDCGDSNMTWYGNNDDKKWFCFNCNKEAN